jgi:hypothetical protein
MTNEPEVFVRLTPIATAPATVIAPPTRTAPDAFSVVTVVAAAVRAATVVAPAETTPRELTPAESVVAFREPSLEGPETVREVIVSPAKVVAPETAKDVALIAAAATPPRVVAPLTFRVVRSVAAAVRAATVVAPAERTPRELTPAESVVAVREPSFEGPETAREVIVSPAKVVAPKTARDVALIGVTIVLG